MAAKHCSIPKLVAVLALLLMPTVCLAAEPAATDSGEPMVDSPLFQLGWPKMEMPKFDWKPWGNGEKTATSTVPKENPISGALDKVAGASKKAADGVRNAWGSAMSKIPSFGGGQDSSQAIAKSEGPGFWEKMFGPQEESGGSETVSEFLAQERLGTTRR